MKKITTLAAFCLVLSSLVIDGGADALERDYDAQISSRVAARFSQGVTARIDDHGRLIVKGSKTSPVATAAPNLRTGTPTIIRPDLKPVAATILKTLRHEMWGDVNVEILKTKVEHSKFGSNSVSTLKIDGYPVIGPQMRVRSTNDGVVTRVKISLPAAGDRPVVSSESVAVTLADAVRTIRQHAIKHHNGLICPDQAQRVWFMTSGGTLIPAARILLQSADMGSLKEAVVDLRTGELVRFAELARR